MNTFSEYLTQNLMTSVWEQILVILILSAIIVFLGMAVNWIVRWLLKYSVKTRIAWDETFLSSIHYPLMFLVWLMGFTTLAEWGLPILLTISNESIAIISVIRQLSITICGAWFAMRFLSQWENIFLSQSKDTKILSFDEVGLRAINKILRIVIIVVAVLLASNNLGFNITGALAFGGLGGLAIGFAAKDMLANFFGGLMIYMDRPFTEGDWIRSPDREIEGTVEKIGWRLTRIRTFERRPLYVPNAMFTQIVVENPSRMESRRLKEIIGVRYDDINKVSVIVDEIKDLLRAHPKIDDRQMLIVGLDTFSEFSVNILTYTYIKEKRGKDFYVTKQEILLEIAKIIEKNGAEIAFPTQTLHIQQT